MQFGIQLVKYNVKFMSEVDSTYYETYCVEITVLFYI